MKQLLLPTLLLITFLGTVVAEDEGLYLRKVVSEGTAGALEVLDKNNQKLFLAEEPVITPADVVSASSEGTETVVIQFTFSESAQERLHEVTQSMIGERLAVIIDGKLIMAPVVRDPFHESVSITGDFTREWADSVVEHVQANPQD